MVHSSTLLSAEAVRIRIPLSGLSGLGLITSTFEMVEGCARQKYFGTT